MWSSSVPEVIILDDETSRDRNHYTAKVAGHYWITVKVLPGLQLSTIGLDIATSQQLHAVMVKTHCVGQLSAS